MIASAKILLGNDSDGFWYEAKLSPGKFVGEVLAFLQTHENLPVKRQVIEIPHDLCASIVREAHDFADERIEVLDTSPAVKVICWDEHWRVIVWTYKKGRKDKIPGHAFLYRNSEKEPFQIFPLPENCSIDPTGGLTMWTTDAPECVAYYPAYQKPWPWPLKDSHPYMVLGILNWLLKTADGNPLTMITEAAQPYRGAGRQVIEKLERMRKLVTKQ